MPDTSTPPRTTNAKAAPRRSRAARILLWSAGLLVLLLVLLAGMAAVATQTEWGARTVWQLAVRALSGKLSGDLVGGTLADGVRLRNVVYQDEQRTVRIDRADGAWRLSRAPLTLTVSSLDIGKVDVTQRPSPEPPEPATLPDEIRLPLAIDVQRAVVEQLVLHQDDAATTFSDIRLAAASDRVSHRLELENATTPWGSARVSLSIDGIAPFATDGSASLAGAWQEERYRLETRLSGTLRDLGIDLEASGDKIAGNARIDATPFAPLPFQRAQVEVKHLNPRVFNESAPQADLDIRADLAPAAAADPGAAPPDLSQLAVAGPITVTNARPGSIDEELLPLVSARADARLTTQLQQLSKLQLRLPGGGLLHGSGEFGAGQGQLALEAERLDLHALHAAARPTQLKGPLTLRLVDDRQYVGVKLTDPVFSVEGDAEITPHQVELHSAQLKSGPARLAVSGRLARDSDAAFSVAGELANFDPARFITTVQPGRDASHIPNARINMRFDVQGALQPEPGATVKFEVRDSMYDNLPMTGGGSLRVQGTSVLSSDAQLSVAGNRVMVKGGFGMPDARLDFEIDAPALARLGFGLSGLLKAEGQLGGTPARPLVNANFRAEKLAFGEHRLAYLSGEARTDGMPGTAPDARVVLDVDAKGLQSGDLSLASLVADINGTYASHALRLDARGRFQDRPLAVTLAAQGRLQELPRGLGWDGTVGTLENRGFPRISMSQPLTLAVAPGEVQLGATRFSIEQAQIDLQSLRYEQDGPIRSAGAFRSLDVGHLLELQRQYTGSAPPFKTNLILDGQWDVALAEMAEGSFRVERRGGDIRVQSGAVETALGVNEMRLDGKFEGDLLRLDARVGASRIGNMSGQGQVALQRGGARVMVAPDSAVSGQVAVSIPRLQSIATLAGPSIALDGSVAIDLTAQGTLAEPVLSGELTGNGLALTLYDQGVRLRDGTARVTLEQNIVELRQVEFRGGQGTLRATGRIPLDRTSPDLAATITADRLQLLADPSANVTVSGQAAVANINRQLQVTGKFTVDRALISMPEQRPPTLDDDVVIFSNGDQPKKQEVALDGKEGGQDGGNPLLPRINIEVDLGRNFRFEGSGAELLLGGTLRIISAPGQAPQAFGTINIVNGTFEAFGAVLAIESGVINFTGSFNNPNIAILAMRRKQQVAAGVRITGNARQPRVELVSEPEVPEEEKLSWLVFGRGASGGGTEEGQARSALSGAALGLLNKFGGQRLAAGLGVDEFAIGESEYGMQGEQVVSIGKEISDRLSIGYEQSLAGAASVFRLTYQLTQTWSVVARGGTITGLEVYYSKRFDRLRRD